MKTVEQSRIDVVEKNEDKPYKLKPRRRFRFKGCKTVFTAKLCEENQTECYSCAFRHTLLKSVKPCRFVDCNALGNFVVECCGTVDDYR